MKIKYLFIFLILTFSTIISIYIYFTKIENNDKSIIKECLNFFTVYYDLDFEDKHTKEKMFKYLNRSCSNEDFIKKNTYTFEINKKDSIIEVYRKNLFKYPKFKLKLFPNNKNERCLNKNLNIGFYSKDFNVIDNVNYKEINEYLIRNLDSIIGIPLLTKKKDWNKYAIFKYEEGILSISCYSNINRNILTKTKKVIENYISGNDLPFDYALIPLVGLTVTTCSAKSN